MNLLQRYDAMPAELPAANMRLHLCLRAPDRIVLVDTCPTREAPRMVLRPALCQRCPSTERRGAVAFGLSSQRAAEGWPSRWERD